MMNQPGQGGAAIKIGIASFHPKAQGGIPAYLDLAIGLLKRLPAADLELLAIPAANNDPLNIEPVSYLLGGAPGTRDEEYQGIPVKVSGIVRRIEAMARMAPRAQWLKSARARDALMVIAGDSLLGFPFSGSGIKYLLLVAASLTDERKYLEPGIVQKFLYIFSLPLLRRMERRTFRDSSFILALNRALADRIIRENRLDPGKVGVFAPPIDAGKFSPPAAPPRPGGVIWTARHNDARKNTALLLRAFTRVISACPFARLTLAGDSPGPRLTALMDRLNLRDRVECRGWVSEPEKIGLLRAADVFALPSNQEGLGIAALEAMACGVPVVSTRCEGPESFITDGVNGFLCPREDPEAMAARLVQLIRDRELRRRLGQAARETVLREFSAETCFNGLLGALKRVWPEHFLRSAADLPVPAPAAGGVR